MFHNIIVTIIVETALTIFYKEFGIGKIIESEME